MPVPLLQLIETRLSDHSPPKMVWRRLMKRSAVAMVLQVREGELHILMIKRAEREGDPWSGHVALPGGRQEAADRDLLATALAVKSAAVLYFLRAARALEGDLVA